MKYTENNSTIDPALRDEMTKQNVFVTTLDFIYNWGAAHRSGPCSSTACCAIEMIAAAARYDIARFGAELFRASPRQADLMIVAGTVTKNGSECRPPF